MVVGCVVFVFCILWSSWFCGLFFECLVKLQNVMLVFLLFGGLWGCLVLVCFGLEGLGWGGALCQPFWRLCVYCFVFILFCLFRFCLVFVSFVCVCWSVLGGFVWRLLCFVYSWFVIGCSRLFCLFLLEFFWLWFLASGGFVLFSFGLCFWSAFGSVGVFVCFCCFFVVCICRFFLGGGGVAFVLFLCLLECFSVVMCLIVWFVLFFVC